MAAQHVAFGQADKPCNGLQCSSGCVQGRVVPNNPEPLNLNPQLLTRLFKKFEAHAISSLSRKQLTSVLRVFCAE